MISHSSVTDAGSGKEPVIKLLVQQPKPRNSRTWILLLLIGLILLSNSLWRRDSSWDISPVHPDQTVVKPPESQVHQSVTLVYANEQGTLVRVPVDAERYSEWIRQQMATLEVSRQQIRQQVEADFAQGVNQIFQVVESRIPRLANWYFDYGTSYKLVWAAMTSTISYLGEDNIKEAVSADIEKLIQTEYEYRVLQPEITDPLIQQLYQRTLQQAHKAYLQTLATMEESFQVFVSEHTSYLSDSPLPPAEIRLDWFSEIHKLRVNSKAPELDVFRGISLTWIGSRIGKKVGIALAARLSMPFAERALITVASGTAGGSTGILGGPVGLVVGAALGLTLDFALQQGLALLARPQFEIEVTEAVRSSQQQLQETLLVGLQKAVDVLFEDNIQLLLQFKQ